MDKAKDGLPPDDGSSVLANILGEWVVVRYDPNSPGDNHWKVNLCDAWFGDDLIEAWVPFSSITQIPVIPPRTGK